jgi:filamentous hemagglutinin family protein
MSGKLKAGLKNCVKMSARVFEPVLMKKLLLNHFRRIPGVVILLMAGLFCRLQAMANPTGGTVAQGAASFNTSGSQLTINAANNTFISWQSFNIGLGETTTFVQPSSSSLVWNQVNDPNPSQILGNLNANGYVVLQNQSGFYIGGQAAISAHGLIMTTAPVPAPDLSSGGAWSFNAPPPLAKIINYGQINIAGGGSAFLIANDIENSGAITAPGGKIGLYAGQTVLVSTSPDGRGLSAAVTLPQGSVDNQGQLIADAGSIVAQAKVVNQNGLVQANSVQNVNGTIELVASDAVNLGASSVISAQGESQGSSAGGAVTIKSDTSFSDQAGSTINIAGGAQGGNGGRVSICAPQMNSIQSTINGRAVAGFVGGTLAVDPANIWLASAATDPSAPAGYTVIDVNSYSGLSLISLVADNNITLNTLWTLTDPGVPATLTLSAGNDVIFNPGSGIAAGNNWSVSLVAGTSLAAGATPATGNDGIYLANDAFLTAFNNNLGLSSPTISLSAANEVQVGCSLDGNGNYVATSGGGLNGGTGSITTTGGGSISVKTQNGDVNTGADSSGFLYTQPSGRGGTLLPPYYTVSSTLGGISTAAGGNVSINAGGNVISYLPSGSDPSVAADAGTGAFGSNPGNVTITAGGNVYGHYVLANGVGYIKAGQNVGTPTGPDSFALSLIAGSWSVNAPNGNIYLQEVRNPNGVFNNTVNDSSVAAHLFDYAPQDLVSLAAGIGVYLTDVNLPRLAADPVPVLYPSILNITAGSGGVTLQGNVTLFPSEYQNLSIITTDGGSLVSNPNSEGTTPELLMSDSSQVQWTGAPPTVNGVLVGGADGIFSDTDHGAGLPVQSADPNPVVLNISGNMGNLNLITSKATQIKVGGDMIDCGFSGQNLHASDTTSITVGGQIYNRSPYNFVYNVSIPSVPTADLLPGMGSSWNNIFTLALNPAIVANITIPSYITSSQQAGYIIEAASLFSTQLLPNGQYLGANPGFVYNPATGRLGFGGQMLSAAQSALTQPITVLHLVNGLPVLDTNPGDHAPGRTYGQYETDTITWVAPSAIQTLAQVSTTPSAIEALVGLNLGAPSPFVGQLGYRLGGPGQFDINAGSISLGNTYGILSCGVVDPQGGYGRYANLASVTQDGGATVNVTVAGDLNMLTSTIAAIGGGNVNVTSTGDSMDLGSQELFGILRQVGFGIFTSGNGNVNVTAFGDINVDGSRIATFDGGNILVESLTGNVNAGSGGATYNGVGVSYVNPATGLSGYYTEYVFGSGIVANTLINPSAVPGGATVPGNITVLTPQGDINASLGGILQEALNGNVSAGPTITLTAGTPASGTPGSPGYSPGYGGNINLGDSGVIGGTVNAAAYGSAPKGNITGLVISRQNSNISAAQNFSGTVLSGGSADVSGGGSVSGTIVGVGGANVSGGSVTATVLSQNASVNGGLSQSTLGSSATASSTSQSAANQASSENKQLASTDTDTSDDDKKKLKKPALRKVSRVTVILSSAVPPQ